MSDNPEFAVLKCETQKLKSSHELDLPVLTKNVDYSSNGKFHRVPSEEFCMNNSELKKQETDTEVLYQGDSFLPLWDGLVARHETETQTSNSLLFTPEANLFLKDNSFLEDSINPRERYYDDILSIDWQDESTKSRSIKLSESTENTWPMGYYECSGELAVSNKPFLRGCSSGRRLPLEKSCFSHEDDLEFPIDDFRPKRRRVCSA